MRRITALLLALMALAVTVSTASAQDGAAERVAAATDAFRVATALQEPGAREEAFRRAAELYRAASADGPRNGALEYNTGNAWFLAGDVGRAILHYRRALDLRPGDPRVEANLDTARTRRRDDFEVTSSRALTDTLLFWHRGVSLRTKIPSALACWALGFVLLASGVWLPRTRPGRAGALRFGGLLLAAAVALGVSALVELRDRDAREAAVVVADDVVLRTGDGTSYPSRYENPIHSGAEVRVVEERAGWAHVELPDGKRGWLSVDAVERI